MGFALKASSAVAGSGEKVPAGNHLAALVAIIDLGTHENEFAGVVKLRRQIKLVWELPSKKIAGTTKNHLMAADVTFSMTGDATLKKWIQSRRGKKISDGEEVDIGEELGKGCLLNVVWNEKGYPRVEGIAAIPDGLPEPTPTYPLTAINLDQFKAGATIPDWIPWHYGHPVAEHIKASRELRGEGLKPQDTAQLGEEYGTSSKDPIPF
jgi:hypothetical protein